MAHATEEPKSKVLNQRDINPVFLHQAGQDTVQDIAHKAQEIFQTLKITQLPNGTVPGYRSNTQEKIHKLKDLLNAIEQLFKKLRVIHNECEKRMADAEHDTQNLVPLLHSKEGDDQDKEKPQKSLREQTLENRKRELEGRLQLKNQQIETLMSQMKMLVWETNSVFSCMNT